MAHEREKKQRLEWFALSYDAFITDPRMCHLSTREKCLWLYLLLLMWPNKGYIPDSVDAFANMLHISKSEAKKLKDKLQAHYLLKHDGPQLYSPRLKREHEIATHVYTQKSIAGKKSAEARKIIQFPQAK